MSVDAVKFHVGNVLGKLGLATGGSCGAGTGCSPDSALMRRGESTRWKHLVLGPIGQIARTVADLAASTAFVPRQARLPHLFTFGELAFFDCGGTRLYLHQDARSAPNRPLPCVADIHAAHRELEAQGVAFTRRTAHDPPPRRRHRGMDGVLQRPRGPAAGADGAGAVASELWRSEVISRRAPRPAARGPRSARSGRSPRYERMCRRASANDQRDTTRSGRFASHIFRTAWRRISSRR